MPSLTDVVKDYLKGKNYTIKAGETLTKIGKRYGMSAQQLWEYEGDTGSPNSDRIAGATLASAKKDEVIKVPILPATVAAADASLTIPANLVRTMQEQWEKSIAMQNKIIRVAPNTPADFNLIHMDQRAQEHGAVLSWVVDDKKLELFRLGAGNSGSYPVDLSLDPKRYILGFLHTHPYTRWTDWDDREDVAFSGGDLTWYIRETAFVNFVQSNEMIFMSMRTDQTSWSKIDAAQAKTDWSAEFTITDYKRQTFVNAVLKATKKICTDYHLALYSGKGGTVTKKN